MNKSISNRPDQQVSHVAAHGCPADTDHDREVPEIDLLSPLTIRGVTLRNRIVMSPMCQYCADGGAGRRLAPRPPRQPGRRRGRRW